MGSQVGSGSAEQGSLTWEVTGGWERLTRWRLGHEGPGVPGRECSTKAAGRGSYEARTEGAGCPVRVSETEGPAAKPESRRPPAADVTVCTAAIPRRMGYHMPGGSFLNKDLVVSTE